MCKKLFISLALLVVVICTPTKSAVTTEKTHVGKAQEVECPTCREKPTGANALVTLPCCKQKICKKCLGKLPTKYPRGDFGHERGFKECPYCRSNITEFVAANALIEPVDTSTEFVGTSTY